MNTRNKLLSFILCITMLFTVKSFVPTAYAIWGVLDVGINPAELVSDLGDWVSDLGDWGTSLAEWAAEKAADVAELLAAQAITAYKIVALLAVQKAVAFFIGDGDGLIIRDYNKYLYISPQQRALSQMTTFYNTTSKGRLSSSNYEGVGPNYDSYLVSQAKQTISGTTFVTNIQERVSNPKQLFSGGNMQGIMSYMQCANNVACYTLVASAQYDKEFAKAQEIAKNEQQNGFLPTKASSGRITKPAALAQNALLQVDQIGTQLIMNADAKQGTSAAVTQIATGATISIASRAINYGISDDAGKAAIVAQNNQFPFSVGYSNLGGVNISAAGVKINTNLGSVSASGQIGNTAVNGSINVNGAGAQVTSSTQKVRQ